MYPNDISAGQAGVHPQLHAASQRERINYTNKREGGERLGCMPILGGRVGPFQGVVGEFIPSRHKS